MVIRLDKRSRKEQDEKKQGLCRETPTDNLL